MMPASSKYFSVCPHDTDSESYILTGTKVESFQSFSFLLRKISPARILTAVILRV